MEIFLYKQKSIENREKNCKQSCSEQKIANVSSVNKCHKIDTSCRVRKTEHMRSRQNVLGQARWRPNCEITWHTEQLLSHVWYTHSEVLLRLMQKSAPTSRTHQHLYN